ncbi:radical SAM protein [Actinophytocola glycyrrhizae]|uniref:Radical SAM protein n=1 Tax=Actinophytocola glycyrrhizae TaxID=2044873 RepID=A0ABV9RW64_9PSEU
MTRRCNAACSFCQAPNTSRVELSVAQIGTVAERLAAASVRSLKVSGGEPTTRADLPEIIHTTATSGLRPVVITNGISLDSTVLDMMVAHDAEFKFSIHRPDARNDRVLRVRAFDRVLANLATCRRRHIAFSLNTVVTSRTVDMMAAMTEFAAAQGARKISFIPVVPRGRAVRSGDHIDEDRLREVHRRVETLRGTYSGRLLVRCIDIRHHDYWIVENDGALWIERAREGLDVRVCGLNELIGLPGRTVEK